MKRIQQRATSNTLDPERLPAFLTTEEVALILPLHENTIRKKAATGEIPAAKIGKKWMFPGKEIALLNEKLQKAFAALQ